MSGCALFASSPAWAIWTNTCNGIDSVSQISLPPSIFAISRQTAVGTFAGEWQAAIPNTAVGGIDPALPFLMCTTRQTALNQSDSIAYNLYVGGSKPASVYPAPGALTVSEGGITYRVFTTQELQSVGLGYVVRWRVTNNINEFGQWVTPPANWTAYMPPATAGMPFYRFSIWRQNQPGLSAGTYIQGGMVSYTSIMNIPQWYAVLNQWAGQYPNANYVIYFGTQVATRFVLIQDPLTIPETTSLDPVSKTRTLQLEVLNPRPNYYSGSPTQIAINQTVTLTLPPTGTCTTPSFTTIPLGTLFENELPVPGSAGAFRTFNLAFTNCPRINIGYYVHANGKWVNSNQGIVGLSGSTPNANPAVGNPRGFGVQLAHNGGPQGTGNLYISPNVDDANKQVYWRTPAQGTNSATGVTHTIALRARVIRTHPTGTPIVPGPFNTSLIFVVQYP